MWRGPTATQSDMAERSPRKGAKVWKPSLFLKHRQESLLQVAQQQQQCELNQNIVYTNATEFTDAKELFAGRHSTVYSAVCRRTEHRVALKAYAKSTLQNRHFINIQREVETMQLLMKLRCPGVVTFLGSFEDKSHIYIVQELCSGGDLFKELLQQGGTMQEPRACTEVIMPLLVALVSMHAAGVVHRDIKPENLFFSDGCIKLGDFGLAINTYETRPTSRVGTLDYMSPEVLKMPTPDAIKGKALSKDDIGFYNDKVDVWGVGILVYELLAGCPPFEMEDPDQTASLIVHQPVEHFPEEMSRDCVSFIKQALTKDPARRPSAAQLLHHPWIRSHAAPRSPRQHLASPPASPSWTISTQILKDSSPPSPCERQTFELHALCTAESVQDGEAGAQLRAYSQASPPWEWEAGGAGCSAETTPLPRAPAHEVPPLRMLRIPATPIPGRQAGGQLDIEQTPRKLSRFASHASTGAASCDVAFSGDLHSSDSEPLSCGSGSGSHSARLAAITQQDGSRSGQQQRYSVSNGGEVSSANDYEICFCEPPETAAEHAVGSLVEAAAQQPSTDDMDGPQCSPSHMQPEASELPSTSMLPATQVQSAPMCTGMHRKVSQTSIPQTSPTSDHTPFLDFLSCCTAL